MEFKKQIKELLKFIFGIGLIILFIRHIQWENFRETVVSVDVSFMIVGILLTFGNVFLAAYRWYVLLKALQITIPFMKVVKLLFVSTFFNTFLPGGFAGDVVRGLQTREEGTRIEDAFSSVFTDRILGLLGLVCLALIGLLFQWELVERSGLMAYLILACMAFIVLTMALYSRRVVKIFRGLLLLFGKWGNTLERLYRSLYQYRHKLPDMVLAFGITLLNHFIMFTSMYFLARSLDVHIPFTYFVLFLPIIGILSMVPITVGGLGLRELGFILLFPLVGMTKSQALGTSLFFFMTMVLVAVTGAGIYLGETFFAMLTHHQTT